jgi:hypothetical protein
MFKIVEIFYIDQIETFQMPSSHFNVSGNDYLTLLVSTCVRLMEFGVHEVSDSVSSQTTNQSEESTIRASSVKLLQLILKHGKHIDQVNRLIIPLSELGNIHFN